ncbi:MAG TPA: tRNA uridine-5-carboxymethylaminomethyl(34) synthesis GTPase MnmE [Polyangia bacterium]
MATGAGSGGVGIVRVSGPLAEAVLRRIVRPLPAALEERRVYVGRAYDPSTGAALDQVMAFLMRSPRSYTGEDVAELQGHGGVANVAALLEATRRAGAGLAGPGEFTRRAFLNGRLDLSQAEAVADVIAARSERALRQAQKQLRGELGEGVRGLRARLVEALAEVEAELDFPEDEDVGATAATVGVAATDVGARARALAGTYRGGRAVREGLEVALVGRPNVGKSSLLNALVGEERAVVDAAPHTTRDYVEAQVVWDGVPVTLIDTAGAGGAELEGVQARGAALGQRRAAGADVVVVVVEAGAVSERDAAVWRAAGAAAGRVLVRSKCDLGGGDAPRPVWAAGQVVTSAVTGAGLADLRCEVLAAGGVGLGNGEAEELVVVASARQRDALLEAAAAAEAASAAARDGVPGEVVALELRRAGRALGTITGEGLTEDVLAAIFSRFCVGK